MGARLEPLLEWPQRGALFGSLIGGMSPEDASSAFARIIGGAFCGRSSRLALAAQSAFLAVLEGSWTAEHRIHTREAAAAQADELTTLFLVEPEPDTGAADDLEAPDYGQARPLTLGERRAIATNPDRRTIEIAMRDPHPMVAARVLDNPKLTENDAVRIAARRHQSPQALRELAVHMRWRTRPRVAMALVNNPNLQPHLGLWLLPTMGVAEVRQVATDNRLAVPIRGGAAALVEALRFRGQLF